MAGDIIGSDWKNFRLHLAKEIHLFQIQQYLKRYYLIDEPTNAALRASLVKDETEQEREGYFNHFEALVKHLIQHELSFYVTTKDDLNEIVGVTLLCDSRSQPWSTIPPPTSPITKNFGTIFESLEEQVSEIFVTKYPCDFYVEIYVVSVHPKFRCQGLATEMYKRSCNFLKAKGYSIVTLVGTHPGTRAIGDKLGFIEIGRTYFKDQLDENGRKMFKYPNDDGFASFTVKVLNTLCMV